MMKQLEFDFSEPTKAWAIPTIKYTWNPPPVANTFIEYSWDASNNALTQHHYFTKEWLETLTEMVNAKYIGYPNNETTKRDIYSFVRNMMPAAIAFSLDISYSGMLLNLKIKIED